MTATPFHIQIVESESKRAYNAIIQNYGFIAKLFDCNPAELDSDLLYRVWDELAYTEIFKATNGDPETVMNPYLMQGVYSTIYDRWPEIYYLELLNKIGVVDKYTIDEDFYIVKEAYIPILNTLITPESTLEGS